MKAVFMDYTGTTVQEKGVEIETVIERICKNSSVKNPEEILALWWKGIKHYEEDCYKDSYRTEDEIVDCLLNDFERDIQLRDNHKELHSLIQKFWINAPLFPDVPEFFEKCPLPIYIISNNGVQYVQKGVMQKNIVPARLVCADMVRAYKPHKELFEMALETGGFKSDEVIHIGDSYESDVIGARAVGIRPILIQRNEMKKYADVIRIRELSEALNYISD